jgi:hypothetical protein
MSIVPLVDVQCHIFHVPSETEVLAFGQSITWILLIIIGSCYTVGSYAFIRAFEDPRPEALFKNSKHFCTDELLGAWIFFIAALPTVPYSMYYISTGPTILIYWGMLLASLMFISACGWFVYVCYPKRHHLIVSIL